MSDQAIIQRLASEEALWIHADDRARKQHRQAIFASGICTLWVHRPKEGMSSDDQLRAVLYRLNEVLRRGRNARGPIHQKVTLHGQSDSPRVKLERYEI